MQASENFHSGTVSGLGARLNLKTMDSIRLQDSPPATQNPNQPHIYLSYIMKGGWPFPFSLDRLIAGKLVRLTSS